MNTRIGVRISRELRERMEQTIKEGKFKDFSALIRDGVEKLLESERKNAETNHQKKKGG